MQLDNQPTAEDASCVLQEFEEESFEVFES